MTAKNDITGDTIVSKAATQAFRDNFDVIFRKKPTKAPSQTGQTALQTALNNGYTSVTDDDRGDHAGHSRDS